MAMGGKKRMTRLYTEQWVRERVRRKREANALPTVIEIWLVAADDQRRMRTFEPTDRMLKTSSASWGLRLIQPRPCSLPAAALP